MFFRDSVDMSGLLYFYAVDMKLLALVRVSRCWLGVLLGSFGISLRALVVGISHAGRPLGNERDRR